MQHYPVTVERKKRRGSFGLDGVKKKGRFAVVSKERRTVDGIVFDSGKEAKRAAELMTMQRAGLISGLEFQPKFPIEVNGIKICTYTADSTYFDEIKRAAVVEDVKSSGTEKDPYYRIRKKLTEAIYGIKVVEVIR